MSLKRRDRLNRRWLKAVESEDVAELGRLLAEDFEGACAHFVKITDRSNRLVPFRLNRVQRVLEAVCREADLADRPLRLWVLKGRQFGCSTFFAIRNAIKAAVWEQNALVLAHLESPGISMFSKVELCLNRFPKGWIAEPVRREKGTEIRWDASLIKRESAERVDAGVSETYQHLHLTEIPLWKDADATMHGLLPTIPSRGGTSVVGEFTARSVGDFTHEMWVESVAGRSGFRALFLPWYWHTEEYEDEIDEDGFVATREEREFREWVAQVGIPYPLEDDGSLDWDKPRGVELSDGQLLWRRRMIRQYRGDIDKFRREFPSTPDEAFQTGGRRVFPPSVADQLALGVKPPESRGEFEVMRFGTRREARFVERGDGELWIWEKPERNEQYVMGVDSSSGQGGDKSAIVLGKVVDEGVRTVVTFQGLRRPPVLARLVRRLHVAYNGAFVVPERNFHGDHVIDVLINELEVRNVYKHVNRSRDRSRPVQQYGFPTSRATKMPMVQKMVQAAYEGEASVPCERLMGEIRNFVYLDDHDDTAGASQGAHDDLVIAYGLMIWGAGQIPSTVSVGGSNEWDEPVVSELTGY